MGSSSSSSLTAGSGVGEVYQLLQRLAAGHRAEVGADAFQLIKISHPSTVSRISEQSVTYG